MQTQIRWRGQKGLLGRGDTCMEPRRLNRNRVKLGMGCKNIQGRKQCPKALKRKFLPKTKGEPCLL